MILNRETVKQPVPLPDGSVKSRFEDLNNHGGRLFLVAIIMILRQKLV